MPEDESPERKEYLDHNSADLTYEQRLYLSQLRASIRASDRPEGIEANMATTLDKYGDTIPPEREPGYIPRAIRVAINRLRQVFGSIKIKARIEKKRSRTN